MRQNYNRLTEPLRKWPIELRDKIVLCGSACLAVRDIRDVHDLDVIFDPDDKRLASYIEEFVNSGTVGPRIEIGDYPADSSRLLMISLGANRVVSGR